MTEKAGWKDRLFGGLKKTSSKLTENLTGLVTKAKLDSDALDDIEEDPVRFGTSDSRTNP
jgi:fused signal recognition particle receptor